MWLPLVIGCSAVAFYRIGQMDYGKGWPLAVLSALLSLLSVRYLPPPLITVGLSQVLLYVALLVFNLTRKRPPRL